MKHISPLLLLLVFLMAYSHGGIIEGEIAKKITIGAEKGVDISLDKKMVVQFTSDTFNLVGLPPLPDGQKPLNITPLSQHGFYKVYTENLYHPYIFDSDKMVYKSLFPEKRLRELAFLLKGSDIGQAEDMKEQELRKQLCTQFRGASLSPDGRQMSVFKMAEKSSPEGHLDNIFLYNIYTYEVVPLFEKPWSIWGEMRQWSPDGTSIVFYGGPKGSYLITTGFPPPGITSGYALYMLDIKKREVRSITSQGTVVRGLIPKFGPLWSPDGEWIVFQNNYNHPSGVNAFTYYVSSKGENPQLLFSAECPTRSIKNVWWLNNKDVLAEISWDPVDEAERERIDIPCLELCIFDIKNNEQKAIVSLFSSKNDKKKISVERIFQEIEISRDRKRLFLIVREQQRPAGVDENGFALPISQTSFVPLLLHIENTKSNPIIIRNSDNLQRFSSGSLGVKPHFP